MHAPTLIGAAVVKWGRGRCQPDVDVMHTGDGKIAIVMDWRGLLFECDALLGRESTRPVDRRKADGDFDGFPTGFRRHVTACKVQPRGKGADGVKYFS